MFDDILEIPGNDKEAIEKNQDILKRNEIIHIAVALRLQLFLLTNI